MVLDRNPKNYFAEVEQSAYSPAHMVPGIEASPDKMLQVQNPKWFLLNDLVVSSYYFSFQQIDWLKTYKLS